MPSYEHFRLAGNPYLTKIDLLSNEELLFTQFLALESRAPVLLSTAYWCDRKILCHTVSCTPQIAAYTKGRHDQSLEFKLVFVDSSGMLLLMSYTANASTLPSLWTFTGGG